LADDAIKRETQQTMSIEIEPVRTIEESRQVEEIILQAWGGDATISIPDHLTITMAKEGGGLVLLARDGSRPVGFCWGFLSFFGKDQKLKHCSHMAGVVPDYQGRQVGEQIKWAQRISVLEMGINLITWTFDPLETKNARLNLCKLGAVCRQYRRDIYGELRDSLNYGIATDRFYMEWWLDSPWVESHVNKVHSELSVAEWKQNGAIMLGQPDGIEDTSLPDGQLLSRIGKPPYLLIAVPRNYQQMKQQDLELARKWRLRTRRLFEEAFESDYTAIDLLVGEKFCYYVLARQFDPYGQF
jgi:predicted GNAT superfamily acetyltransferase